MKVLISGGGTGGHIFPALAIAGAVRRLDPDAEILFVGALGRMEMERVPAAGYRIIGLPVAGFNRRKLWKNFGVVVKLLKSMRLANKVLKEFRPDICVGVGGYASGPMLKAAQKKGIPTLIQEQNSYPGVTNKLLAKKAAAVCVAYDGLERFFPADKIEKTGNPVRAGIADSQVGAAEAKAALGFPADKPLVAVVGGSLGARTVNDSMKSALAEILETGASVLWQTGKLYDSECQRFAEEFLAERPEVSGRLQVKPFIDRMDLVYAGADVMVSRAGASTISEIQIAGMASVLVPSPNVAEDHQRHNAEALADRGAAVMVLDRDCRGQLGGAVRSLLSLPEKLESIRREAKAMALPGADDLIAERLLYLVKH